LQGSYNLGTASIDIDSSNISFGTILGGTLPAGNIALDTITGGNVGGVGNLASGTIYDYNVNSGAAIA
jgi:hypothetical protein